MEEQKTAVELLRHWLNAVMSDKVIFAAIIDKKLAENIGLKENTLENIVSIIRDAAKELTGKKISAGLISNILIEKKGGLWKIIVFKEKELV